MFESLRNLFDLKKLGFFKENRVVGIDIGSSSIKAVQVRKEKGKAILETYGEIQLGGYAGLFPGQSVNLPPEKIAEALKDLFKQANITTRQAVLSVPLKSSLLTLIELPLVDEKKLQQMIEIEARKYIPVPMSEVLLDYSIIPKNDFSDGPDASPKEEKKPVSGVTPLSDAAKKIENVEILVAAMHKSVLSTYNEIVTKAELKVDTSLEIETFSAARAILGSDISASAIIDIGASATRLLIVDYGVMRTAHSIGKGSQDISLALSKSLGLSFVQAEEAKKRLGAIGKAEGGNLSNVVNPTLEYIFYEAQKILLAYQKKYSRSISKVVLVGGGALLKGINKIATDHLEMKTEIGNAFKKVEAPAFIETMLSETGAGFAVAVGLALRGLSE